MWLNSVSTYPSKPRSRFLPRQQLHSSCCFFYAIVLNTKTGIRESEHLRHQNNKKADAVMASASFKTFTLLVSGQYRIVVKLLIFQIGRIEFTLNNIEVHRTGEVTGELDTGSIVATVRTINIHGSQMSLTVGRKVEIDDEAINRLDFRIGGNTHSLFEVGVVKNLGRVYINHAANHPTAILSACLLDSKQTLLRIIAAGSVNHAADICLNRLLELHSESRGHGRPDIQNQTGHRTSGAILILACATTAGCAQQTTSHAHEGQERKENLFHIFQLYI